MTAPIADPFAPPTVFPNEETRVFKHDFWRVYFATLRFSLLVGVMLSGVGSLFPSGAAYLERNGKLLGFAVVGINPLVSALGMARRPVRITRRGPRAAASSSFSLSIIGWEQIKQVHFFWWGLPYARVSLHKRVFAWWMPLTLADFAGFARTLDEWAPENNPLRIWAQRREPKS